MCVRDVLDFFARCPRCGYAAQATAVERELACGRTEVLVQVGCALPCGWQELPRPMPARDRARLS
ncbi:hypothetical protein [Nocardia sp. NPDC057227]|uniref:hypothetical protein n=1 Tax=Nocardia sp. NPDC057227 TaxID=3346056 RepID=UPI0036420782